MPPEAERLRSHLYQLLGELPDRKRRISVYKQATDSSDMYTKETLRLELNGIEPVPAYFAYPRRGTPPWPTILYNHAHGNDYRLGKDELVLGRQALQSPPYVEELTDRGYAVLCFDAWCFGQRHTRSESDVFKEMLWSGRVMWGMMVYDSLRAVDYLISRQDVDGARLGTLGISMGSTMAWWLAALDTRIKVCIDLCCLTDFQALIESGGLDKHGIYYYVPSLLKEFTTTEINRLIVPRPHLSLAGNLDPLTPPAGLDRIDAELRAAYEAAGAPDAWRLKRYNVGHLETAEMRDQVVAFLAKHL